MKNRIERTEDLQSVVSTMKALAAVSIRQYERAVESIDEYNRTVDLGLRIVLGSFSSHLNINRQREGSQNVAIVVGSDQGMCGKFNEDIFHFSEKILPMESADAQWRVITVGERVASIMEQSSWPVMHRFGTPSSTSGITSLVQNVHSVLGNTENLASVLLLHNGHESSSSYKPSYKRLLPLDRDWLESFCSSRWPTNRLPLFTVDRDGLFAFLIRQYLFVSIYRGIAHSLAAENASRLAAMQVAEKNIDERLDELTSDYHRQRQSAITEELLDIVSGFEVLTE
jgi:F-type H+-transporting ATPase subunit gamma